MIDVSTVWKRTGNGQMSIHRSNHTRWETINRCAKKGSAMKATFWGCMLVWGIVLSGPPVYGDGFYVIPVQKKDYAPVEKSGQTTQYRPNDDGDLEKGVTWPTPRFKDNGDGTVRDILTGLVWLKDASCDSHRTWDDAVDWAAELNDGCLACGGTNNDCGLSDGSRRGDWRLPHIKELFSLIDSGQYTPALPSGHPFIGVQSNVYWSSTTIPFSTQKAWYVNVDSGAIGADVFKTSSRYVWPVRGGQ